MIPAGLKAGSMALKMLRTLYKAKKGIRTGASTSSKFLATKGMDKSAKKSLRNVDWIDFYMDLLK